jgi:hypothetical protein
MIEANDVRRRLLKATPSFQSSLEVLLAEWKSEPPGICLELAEFGLYLAELLRDGNLDDATAGLQVIEQLLLDGTPKVKDAASTCGLEALDAHAAAFGLDTKGWGGLLPPAARAFLVDWHGDPGRCAP